MSYTVPISFGLGICANPPGRPILMASPALATGADVSLLMVNFEDAST